MERIESDSTDALREWGNCFIRNQINANLKHYVSMDFAY